MSAILDLGENGFSEVEIYRTFFCGFFMIYSNNWVEETFCYNLFHVKIKFTPLFINHVETSEALGAAAM